MKLIDEEGRNIETRYGTDVLIDGFYAVILYINNEEIDYVTISDVTPENIRSATDVLFEIHKIEF